MKRINFILIILLCIICPTFGYAIHLSYNYDVNQIRIKTDTINKEVYSSIIWTNAQNEAMDIGSPDCPIFHHSISLEKNIALDSVKVVLSDSSLMTILHQIKPTQAPIPTSCQYQYSFAKNDSTYLANGFYPNNQLVSYRIDYSRDNSSVSFEIAPLKYNPTTNQCIVYSKADVEVYVHQVEQANRSYVDIGIPYYEYTIITSSALAPAFERFANWKRAKGYNVGIVAIEAILSNSHLSNGDTISHIIDDAGKLRQYLIYSYNSVNTKYVLLAGDSAVLPIRYAHSSGERIPTDFYFCDLSSNWNGNNNSIYGEFGYLDDGIDFGAEIYVGRLLCDNQEEVSTWTEKVLRYEINPGRGDYSYLGRALFTQADQMQLGQEAESIQQKLHGIITCTILNETPSSSALNPTGPLGSDIISTINANKYGLLSNFNHGGKAYSYNVATAFNNDSPKNIVASYDSYDNLNSITIVENGNGFDNLTNYCHPSILYSISCYNMPFDMYETPIGTYNLGRTFTCRVKGGGAAYMGNTRDGYITSSTDLFIKFIDTLQNNINNNHLGIAEAKSKKGSSNGTQKWVAFSHNLLGCPEMSLYMGIPNTFDNLNVNESTNQISVSTGSVGLGTRICLSGYINSELVQFVVTDQNSATFTTIPEKYTIVVSKPNFIPYIYNDETCFIQDEIITSNENYSGCSTFSIGSNISPFLPYGEVKVENGAKLTIQNNGSVIIKNDFEVKQGGELIIQ